MSFLDSKRIVGTSTQRTGADAIAGGWKELGRISGSRTINNSLTVSSLADKRYYMILGESQGGATYTNDIRFNADSGSNYAIRQSVNGGTDGAYASQTFMNFDGTGSDTDKFGVGYIANLSTKEKLYQSHVVQRGSAGASNDPKRGEFAGKWANTSNAINSISMLNRGSGTSSGGELVVLGYDPDDTHTDNFWEELADVTLGSDASEISSGTITAKKYLWVQVYFQNASNSNDVLVRFNNDTGSNYAHRHAINYGSDTTQTSGSSIKLIDRNGAADTGRFVNFFAINNSAKEKLLIAHGMEEETSGAGNPPTSNECVGKWVNTSSQITEIDCFTESGNIRSGARLKVWGSN